MRSPRVPVPSYRILIVGWWFAGLAILGLIGYLLVTVIQLSGRSELSQADRADIRDEVSSLESDLSSQEATSTLLAEQIESLGQVPVVEPTTEPSSTTSPTPSFSFIQRLVDLGIAARCPGGSCVGPPGAPAPAAEDGTDGQDGVNGRDGETPSTELLLSLIQPLIPAPVPGINAPRITSVGCNSLTPIDLTFAFDDGTVLTASCGPAVDPEPETPVEPAG